MNYKLPPEWVAAGARWGDDELLYLAEWRRGFTVHELRAMFFDCQQVRSLRSEAAQLKTDVDELTAERNTWQKHAAFYRRQCVLEARLGMCLSRIA